MKGIRAPGVLCGTKWANICLVKFIHPKTINEIQSGADRVRVVTICLVLVKI